VTNRSTNGCGRAAVLAITSRRQSARLQLKSQPDLVQLIEPPAENRHQFSEANVVKLSSVLRITISPQAAALTLYLLHQLGCL
jgi:hypothetical protein